MELNSAFFAITRDSALYLNTRSNESSLLATTWKLKENFLPSLSPLSMSLLRDDSWAVNLADILFIVSGSSQLYMLSSNKRSHLWPNHAWTFYICLFWQINISANINKTSCVKELGAKKIFMFYFGKLFTENDFTQWLLSKKIVF